MKIIKDFKVENYRNVEHAKLENLKDLNIFIGPNNCGKTNFLEFISSFSNLRFGGAYGYSCPDCNKFGGEISICLPLRDEDFYLRKSPREIRVNLKISLYSDTINELVPRVLKKQKEKLEKATCPNIGEEIEMENLGDHTSHLYVKHLSPFIHEDIIDEIKKSILYCPEGRLQSYKEKKFDEFIREIQPSGADYRRLIKFIGDLVDPTIHDHRYEDLIKRFGDEDFITSIKEQGSGVRSLICLVADILFKKDAKILLIDEPELGLNPKSKQTFLKFLLEESGRKQVFIATHDPTFVNPSLWKGYDVSVYLYSPVKKEFVKVNLEENKEDPETFAGYLPHTTSLKDIHIYVEGSSDVYIFEAFLRKYLKQVDKNWAEILQRIGIFHLGGGFWEHLLYTIPECPPYRCAIILDNHEKEKAKEACKIAEGFEFCENLGKLREVFGTRKPIYCLTEEKIEKYFGIELPESYNKKVDGPNIAEKMENVHEEIKKLFEVILVDVNRFVTVRNSVRGGNCEELGS